MKKTIKLAVKPTINFQEQFTALEAITAEFEAGSYDLETGLQKFSEGLLLAKNLQQHLNTVQNSLETIKQQYHESSSKKKTK